MFIDLFGSCVIQSKLAQLHANKHADTKCHVKYAKKHLLKAGDMIICRIAFSSYHSLRR